MTTLNDKHLAEFRLSGISDEMVAAAGIYSVDSKQVREILGYQPSHMNWGEGWAIPFRFPDEPESKYGRVKLDFPRHDADGKVTKYESPRGKPNRPYFPPGFWKAWEAGKEVVVTEGEKKALKATQEGLACIGLVGVWGFQQKRLRDDQGRKYGKTELVPDLAALNWAGKTVHVVYDSDAATKEGVRFAEAKLAEVLTRHGAKVKIVRLPPGTQGTKVGLDDYLVSHSVDELKGLLAKGVDAEKPGKLGPMDWATMFIEGCQIPPRPAIHQAGGLGLRWYRDQFYIYRHTYYRTRSDGEMEKIVIEWLDANGGPADPGFAKKVLDCVAAQARIDEWYEQPLWIGENNENGSAWTAMKDGIFNIKELAKMTEGTKETRRDHSPEFFSTACLPYCYDPEAECPNWTQFLKKVLQDDEDLIDLLQEWFGYNLIFDTSQHKFMIMVGEGANGKSVALEVLEALLGTDNVSHVSLEAFGQRFALASTIGKLANIIPEVGELAKPDEATFKAYVAGDPIQIDRKHRDPLQAKPTARVTIATNVEPRWNDKSDGIWRRMLLIPFKVQIAEEDQNKDLAKEIIRDELAGVFRWALAGLHRLRERGRFTEVEAVVEAKEEAKETANPARRFLLGHVDVGGEHDKVAAAELYHRYDEWCRENGYKSLGASSFGKEVGRAFGAERKKENELVKGIRTTVWYYLGLQLGCAA